METTIRIGNSSWPAIYISSHMDHTCARRMRSGDDYDDVGDDDDTEDDDDVDDGYVMLPLCSQLSPHSHFVYSPGFLVT